MLCGESFALSVMVTAATAGPITVGWKWAWIKQFAPTATVPPQVLPTANCEVLLPVIAMLVIVRGAVPVLVTLTHCDPLHVPTAVDPNAMLLADSVTAGKLTPVPLTAMDWVAPDTPRALSVITTLPELTPAPVGSKFTDTSQLELWARVELAEQRLPSEVFAGKPAG
jgi:hypothetical protein